MTSTQPQRAKATVIKGQPEDDGEARPHTSDHLARRPHALRTLMDLGWGSAGCAKRFDHGPISPTWQPGRAGLDGDPLRAHQSRVATPACDRRPGRPASRTGTRERPVQRDQVARRRRYVTPNDEHEGRGPAIRKARQERLENARQTTTWLPPTHPPSSTRPRTGPCCLLPAGSLSLTQKHVTSCAGVPLQDVRDAAGHADQNHQALRPLPPQPRPHPTCILAPTCAGPSLDRRHRIRRLHHCHDSGIALDEEIDPCCGYGSLMSPQPLHPGLNARGRTRQLNHDKQLAAGSTR